MSTACRRLKSTLVIIRYINPPLHGHTSEYHGHEWMTHILFVQSAQYPINSLPFISHQSDQQFLRYSYFKIWPWNIRGQVSEVKGQGHILYPVSNWCTSFLFHSNQTNRSWDMAKTVFDLEKTHPHFSKKICQNNSLHQNFTKIQSGNNHD